MIDIDALIEEIKKQHETRTREQRIQLLKDAKIIDDDGFLHPDYFSEESVRADRAKNHPIK